MIPKPYYELPGLNNLYLEDSYVLNINEKNNYIEFLIEAVLIEEHPLHHPPSPQEQYCYQKAKICFFNTRQIIWLEKTNVSYKDPDNEIDHGNIDVFYQFDNYFYLEGDWSQLKIVESLMSVEILN
ncbi:MAG: hypothetical protein AAGF83_13510 [Cyanobacteria bacterium P01_G01_bin.67]